MMFIMNTIKYYTSLTASKCLTIDRLVAPSGIKLSSSHPGRPGTHDCTCRIQRRYDSDERVEYITVTLELIGATHVPENKGNEEKYLFIEGDT